MQCEDEILAIINEEQDENMDLHILNPEQAIDRPRLMVIVHPGDVISEGLFLDRMTKEAEIFVQEGGSVAILHRFSTLYLIEEDANTEDEIAWEEFIRDLEAPLCLYGDRLDDAAAALMERAPEGGWQDVLLTGAWSDPEHGCVAALAEGMRGRGQAVRISEHSPNADRDRGMAFG